MSSSGENRNYHDLFTEKLLIMKVDAVEHQNQVSFINKVISRVRTSSGASNGINDPLLRRYWVT